MRDTPNDARNALTALQAFLYASGELGEAENALFEQRLGEDQSAREALCQAVQLAQVVRQQPPLAPDPAYRERVRGRLRQRGRWSWLIGARTYRGHPAVWCATGAAAAVILVMALVQLPSVLSAQAYPPLPPASMGGEREPEPDPVSEPPQLVATEDMAKVWASLNRTSHVTKAHDEEMRRKQRSDDRLRGTRSTERRPRPASESAPR